MKTLVRTTMAVALMAAGNLKANDFFPVGGSIEEMLAWQCRQRREIDARYERMQYEAQQRQIEYQQQRILEELEQLRIQSR